LLTEITKLEDKLIEIEMLLQEKLSEAVSVFIKELEQVTKDMI